MKKKILKYIVFVSAFFFGIMFLGLLKAVILPPLEFEEINFPYENVGVYENADSSACKHNPLLLVIWADRDKNIYLNYIKKGKIEDLSLLDKELADIFRERERKTVF